MVSREIRSIAEESHNKPIAFWGAVIAIYSILYGAFYLRHTGYLINQAEPYMSKLPEKGIGAALIIFGILKLVGVATRNKKIKRIGIWGLATIWGGLLAVAFLFSFGSGYPSSQWIDKLLVVIICSRISFRGDFYPYDN